MQLAFFDLPVEILDQIFLDAVSVRTCPRAVRLRLVSRELFPYSVNTNKIASPWLITLEPRAYSKLHIRRVVLTLRTGTFDYYVTKAILRGHILDKAFRTRSLCVHSLRSQNGISSDHFGKPGWLRLITKYISRRIYKTTHATSRGWRDAHILDLAQRVYEMRPGSSEEGSGPEDGMLHCLEHVVELDLYKGQWLERDYLMDQLDDSSWKTDGFTSDLLDVAVWLDDVDLIRQLLPIEETEIRDEDRRAARLSIRLVMAGERSNFRTLRFLHSHRQGPDAKLPSRTILSLLVRGYQSANPNLFHFALDEYDEEEPINADDLGYIALYCPSSHAYRRIIWMLQKWDPFYFDERSVIGCDPFGTFRLSRAARQGYLELVKYFVNGVVPFDHLDRQRGLENETDEKERYRFLGCGLLGAILGGSLPVVEFLLDSGASPHSYPCLNEAIRRGSREITELLVWYGADVTWGFPPPISIAVVQEDMDLFRYLLERGALSGSSGWLGSAWGMGLAKLFGLDSMVAELVRAGVSEDLRIHWVPTRDEERELPWRPQKLRFAL